MVGKNIEQLNCLTRHLFTFAVKVHENAMHLHAIATLKVVIGTTTPTENEQNTPVANGVDKDNNKVQANGHVTQNGKLAELAITPDTVTDSLPEVTIAPSVDGENGQSPPAEDAQSRGVSKRRRSVERVTLG